MTQQPYIVNVRGKFRLVWAEEYNGRYDIDRRVTPQQVYSWVESACISAYGVKPEPYGIGF